MKFISILVVVAALSMATVASAAVDVPGQNVSPELAAAQAREALVAQQKIDEAAKNADFEAFRATTYKEPFENGGFIVDGDLFIPDENELYAFYTRAILARSSAFLKQNKSGGLTKFLLARRYDGYDDVWDATQKHSITYCVSIAFGPAYANVVRAMDSATAAWQASGDVTFLHSASEDGNCGPNNINVVFDVRPVNVNGEYLARAFFPSYRRSDRNILIDATALRLPVEPPSGTGLTGVLRHELGHTLGARHEHTRPESGACFEDANFVIVTAYDAFSVMHYPQCNGRGDWTLRLTPKDRSGVACIYGPSGGFTIDPAICKPRELEKLNQYGAF